MQKAILLSLLFTLIPFTGAARAESSPLFSSDTVLRLRLEADFQKAKAANGDGNWKGDDRSDPKFWTDFKLVDAAEPAREFTGKLRARGMSSGLDGEGDFPKLKLELSKKEDRKGSVFAGDREFRVNTHVSTYPDRKFTEMGRLNDERSPFREALVYEWAGLLGLPSFGHRRAEITYIDTAKQETFTRQAMLLEKDASFAKRYGGRVVPIEEFASRPDTGISAADSARIHLFQALIGNKDFLLRVNGEPPRQDDPIYGCGNCVVLEREDGSRTVAPYDFDLSTFVAGDEKIQGQWGTYPYFYGDEPSSYLAWFFTTLRARHPEAAVRTELAKILGQAAVLEAAARAAPLDEEGRSLALLHLARFRSMAAQVLEFPVIASTGIPFTKDSELRQSKLRAMPDGKQAFLRPSTPVKVLGREGNSLRVAILDFHWDLAEGETNVGYIPAGAALAGWAPEALLPYHDARDAPEPDSRRQP